jgi:hypothetical protein
MYIIILQIKQTQDFFSHDIFGLQEYCPIWSIIWFTTTIKTHDFFLHDIFGLQEYIFVQCKLYGLQEKCTPGTKYWTSGIIRIHRDAKIMYSLCFILVVSDLVHFIIVYNERF